MHRILIVAGLLIVAAVVTGAALLTRTGMPLAYRGALTRHAYAELARGHLPALRCVTARDSAVASAMSLADGKLRCEGGSVESGDFTRLVVEDGWVYRIERVRWVAAAHGRALADSLVQVVTRERGAPPVRCRVESGGAETRWLYWGPNERSSFAVELRDTPTTHRAGRRNEHGAREWEIFLDRHHGRSECRPA